MINCCVVVAGDGDGRSGGELVVLGLGLGGVGVRMPAGNGRK